MIDVEADGKSYEEMHVDGGTATQVFVYPAGMRLSDLSDEHGVVRERTLYVIRNARLDPEWAEVDRRTLPIALRAITCLIQYQGIGDLYRIYSITQRDGVDYNLAYIPADVQDPAHGGLRPRVHGKALRFRIPDGRAGRPLGEAPADPGFRR